MAGAKLALSVSTAQVCAKASCLCGSSALATMIAPATFSKSQWIQPSATRSVTSAAVEGVRACQPKMLSELSRTDDSDNASLWANPEWAQSSPSHCACAIWPPQVPSPTR